MGSEHVYGLRADTRIFVVLENKLESFERGWIAGKAAQASDGLQPYSGIRIVANAVENHLAQIV